VVVAAAAIGPRLLPRAGEGGMRKDGELGPVARIGDLEEHRPLCNASLGNIKDFPSALGEHDLDFASARC